MYSRLLSRPSRRKAIPFERLGCRRQLVGHRPEPVPRSQPADRRNTRHSHGDDAQRRAPSGFHQRPGGGTAVTAASCSPARSIGSSSGPPCLPSSWERQGRHRPRRRPRRQARTRRCRSVRGRPTDDRHLAEANTCSLVVKAAENPRLICGFVAHQRRNDFCVTQSNY